MILQCRRGKGGGFITVTRQDPICCGNWADDGKCRSFCMNIHFERKECNMCNANGIIDDEKI